MLYINVKCKDCNHIFEVDKTNSTTDFVFKNCPKCNSKNIKRVWEISAVSIARGKLGNSSNNYSNGITYHPSTLTGKVKGKKIKIIK